MSAITNSIRGPIALVSTVTTAHADARIADADQQNTATATSAYEPNDINKSHVSCQYQRLRELAPGLEPVSKG
jgi:hypothetical protein